MNLYLAQPRGFCAGVDRAIEIVEKALNYVEPPVYVRHEIVHNDHVVERLKERGAVFVDDLELIPEGSLTIFSAHGVSPEVRQQAKNRNLKLIDATCPLVTKVHLEAIKFARKGYQIILIGHRNHVEVEGTMGEAPEAMTLVETLSDIESLAFDSDQKLVYLTQTTLSVDDTSELVAALRQKYPQLEAPPKNDICYATTNRQQAVKELAQHCDLVLVLGSKTSSNSNRLVEVARQSGTISHLINDASDLSLDEFAHVQSVGITAGASAPEDLVQDVVVWLEKNFPIQLKKLPAVEESVQFTLPKSLQELERNSL